MLAPTQHDESVATRKRHVEKMDAVARLAGGISRDIGDLVEGAGATARQLLDEIPPTHPAYARIAEIRESMLQVAAVTRQLRAFARPALVRPRTIDLNDVVARMRPLLDQLAGPFIAITIDTDSDSVWTDADFGQVEQIVLNLVVNARDAMPLGGTLRIATSHIEQHAARDHVHGVLPAGSWATLTVRDSGTGMTPDVLARLFEPFFTTKESGRGTGLGLATVYGIARQAAGQVMVESEPGQGTAVVVALPTQHAPRAQLSLDTRSPDAILVVDDDEWVRTVASRVLRRAGFGVLAADSGPAALEILRGVAGGCVRLVLTDMMMPGMSGPALAATVRRDFPYTPVLMMTGFAVGMLPPDRLTGLGDTVLAKPFTPVELLAAVRHQLNGAA